ncbi:MAG: hypothetical protein ACRDRU_17850 [Pseudonocardiaceae bacterium]
MKHEGSQLHQNFGQGHDDVLGEQLADMGCGIWPGTAPVPLAFVAVTGDGSSGGGAW